MLTGTSMPSSVVPSQAGQVDKALHFSIYAVLAFLLTRLTFEGLPRHRAAAIAVLIAVLFGAVDEWHQSFIPGRSKELADWFADTAGATCGAIVAALLGKRSPENTRPA
jgi:VanZ family protein